MNNKKSVKNTKINKRNNLINRLYKNLIKIKLNGYIKAFITFSKERSLLNKNNAIFAIYSVFSVVNKASKRKAITKRKAFTIKLKLKEIFLNLNTF
jgi:ribosomal protein S20